MQNETSETSQEESKVIIQESHQEQPIQPDESEKDQESESGLDSMRSPPYRPVMFYNISSFKFILLYVLTIGLFPWIWAFINFRAMGEDENGERESLFAFIKTVFIGLTIFSIASRIAAENRQKNIKGFMDYTIVAAIYLVSVGAMRFAPDIYLLPISLLQLLLYLVFNSALIRINRLNFPDVKPSKRIQGWEWLLPGIPIVLILVGAIYGEAAFN